MLEMIRWSVVINRSGITALNASSDLTGSWLYSEQTNFSLRLLALEVNL